MSKDYFKIFLILHTVYEFIVPPKNYNRTKISFDHHLCASNHAPIPWAIITANTYLVQNENWPETP